MTVRIQFEGLEEAQRALNNLGDKIERPGQKLMARLGEEAMEDIDQRFMSAGYGTWPALKRSTIRKKKGSFILIDTGEMFAGTRIAHTTDNRVRVETNKHSKPSVPYFHQEGTGKMVRRPIIEVTPQLLSRLAACVGKWMDDMVRAFGTEVK